MAAVLLRSACEPRVADVRRQEVLLSGRGPYPGLRLVQVVGVAEYSYTAAREYCLAARLACGAGLSDLLCPFWKSSDVHI